MRHFLIISMLLSICTFAESLDWLKLDGRHLKCTEDEDFYDFYFHQDDKNKIQVDGWAHDWRNGYQNQYLMAPLKLSTSQFSNRCQIGAVIRLHDQSANREFVHEHVLSDMCAHPRKPMSYLIDSDGNMTHLNCQWR